MLVVDAVAVVVAVFVVADTVAIRVRSLCLDLREGVLAIHLGGGDRR